MSDVFAWTGRTLAAPKVARYPKQVPPPSVGIDKIGIPTNGWTEIARLEAAYRLLPVRLRLLLTAPSQVLLEASADGVVWTTFAHADSLAAYEVYSVEIKGCVSLWRVRAWPLEAPAQAQGALTLKAPDWV